MATRESIFVWHPKTSSISSRRIRIQFSLTTKTSRSQPGKQACHIRNSSNESRGMAQTGFETNPETVSESQPFLYARPKFSNAHLQIATEIEMPSPLERHCPRAAHDLA